MLFLWGHEIRITTLYDEDACLHILLHSLCLGKELPIDNIENVLLGVRGCEGGVRMGIEERNRTAFSQMGLGGHTWAIFVNSL